MKKALLIPIKDPERAKTRLAGLLSADERRALACAMFEDVTRAVSFAHADMVAVVTTYEPAIERARKLGWETLVEEAQSSESASVDWASRRLAEMGFDAVMRLPADVPLVRAEDIDSLLRIDLPMPAALMVPSREGTGTNAIIRTPPCLFRSRFGPDSLALHKAEATRVGVRCLIVENARIALDIDEPADIRVLIESESDTETRRLLVAMNVIVRMKNRQD
ncbi:MAG: 2-phospho-L-lactate guanylyltransferase [Acidobacteriota bacterium]